MDSFLREIPNTFNLTQNHLHNAKDFQYLAKIYLTCKLGLKLYLKRNQRQREQKYQLAREKNKSINDINEVRLIKAV